MIALTLEAERKFRRGWGARVNYTFSRTSDNVSGEVNAFSNRNGSFLDSYDLDSEYSRSITDIPHRWNVSGIVELPLGLTFSVTGYFQSGFPVAVFQGLNNTGLLGDLQRPNLAAGVVAGHEGGTEENLESYLNRAGWTQAPAFTSGMRREPTPASARPRHNWDVALQKNLSAGAGDLLLRVEVINLFDRPDFLGPVTNFSSPKLREDSRRWRIPAARAVHLALPVVGTRRFSSSNQFWTTWMGRGVVSSGLGRIMRNRPSGATS